MELNPNFQKNYAHCSANYLSHQHLNPTPIISYKNTMVCHPIRLLYINFFQASSEETFYTNFELLMTQEKKGTTKDSFVKNKKIHVHC
jgi:hypothetical protein